MAGRAVWLLVCALGGCHSEDDETTTDEPAECAPGEYRRDDGVCLAPGLPPDMPCAPGEWQREDGACIPAGVPPDGCAAGFVHDGDRGCEPILPAAPCPDGQMAVPGETRCREIAPCGTPPWGDIPVEMTTVYVDASYSGGNGSAAAPWTTIQEGINAAASGAIVAIAAGDYVEDVIVEGKPVRLWGRCPSLVKLSSTAAPEVATLFIRRYADGTEVHRVSIAGQALGVALAGSEDVVVEESWIHDNAARGLEVVSFYGPTSIAIRDSLLERNVELGVIVIGAQATIEATVVRDSTPAFGSSGRGVSIESDDGAPGTLVMQGSLLERNHEIGVFVSAARAEVEATVVRETMPDAYSVFGRGFGIEDDPTTGTRATLSLRGSVVEKNQGLAVSIYNSDATVEATVVRDTLPNAQNQSGQGITASDDAATGSRSSVAVRTSLVERNHEVGVFVFGADATVEASVVRDTIMNAQGHFGRGIAAEDDPASGARANVTVRSSLLERNHEVGLFVGGSDGDVETTAVRDTFLNGDAKGGHAVHIESNPATGTIAAGALRASLLEGSLEGGLLVVGQATFEIDDCLIRATAARDGYLGDGVIVWSADGAASATVTGTRIENSERAAISSFGAHVALSSSHFVCQAFDLAAESWEGLPPAYQDLGDVWCGCPTATEPCRAQSYLLEPPPPLP